MAVVSYLASKPTTGNRWFAIVATAEPDCAIELFEAPGWAPAILAYAERMRADKLSKGVSLREARDSELDAETVRQAHEPALASNAVEMCAPAV